jgi:hypothetical protein
MGRKSSLAIFSSPYSGELILAVKATGAPRCADGRIRVHGQGLVSEYVYSHLLFSVAALWKVQG